MRIADVSALGRYEAVYVASDAPTVPLSCAARLLSERDRGLRALVVVVGPSPEPEEEAELRAALDFAGSDYLLGCGIEDPPSPPALSVPLSVRADPEAQRVLAGFLEQTRLRTRPRRVYLPLGLGGRLTDRMIQDAGVEVFGAETRDLLLYEERPAALIPGAVRLRLAQLGASLPAGVTRLPPSSPMRLVIGFLRAPHLSARFGGVGERLRTALALVREWKATRGWRPRRAFGLRIQPVLQEPHADAPRIVDFVKPRVPRLFGSPKRMTSAVSRHRRTLGSAGSVERYWLLLPVREAVTPFVPADSLEAEAQG